MYIYRLSREIARSYRAIRRDRMVNQTKTDTIREK